MARDIVATPNAIWLGINPEQEELHQYLHDRLIDARREGRVPVIVVYGFPNRQCKSARRHGKRLTAEVYQSWLDRVSNALRYYAMPMYVILEPGGLSELVTDRESPCGKRTKSDVLKERIKLYRYASWVLNPTRWDKDGKKHRTNRNIRIFIDAGNPSTVSGPRERMLVADALEKVLTGARFDGVSVNVGAHDSLDAGVAFGKKIIGLVRPKAGRMLTVAADIGLSGARGTTGCGTSNAALDAQQPTLDYPDPRVELATIMKLPGESGSPACKAQEPPGDFNPHVFAAYVRNSAAQRSYAGH